MKIPSNKRLIPNISEIFIQYLHSHNIKDADAMQIAFEEALTNAIVHGNNNDYNKNVNISFSIKQNMLEISIKDEGKGFNYKSIKTNDDDIYRKNGRGILLISLYTDSFHFEDYGRKIVMNKYIS
ncbi:ATP-binding protein [Brachyspira pilosicoli]|uniref:ATP-binding protein n=1 Tax=Brachyspira pilosicoli TaxID=52584 RepID=A0A5C8EQT8_BRAPL|nr:ATP-binding protein [Brachyspira pilosicoli]TXJ39693.1 ATP-binding protein [Brachyspira pilosicoli]